MGIYNDFRLKLLSAALINQTYNSSVFVKFPILLG